MNAKSLTGSTKAKVLTVRALILGERLVGP